VHATCWEHCANCRRDRDASIEAQLAAADSASIPRDAEVLAGKVGKQRLCSVTFRPGSRARLYALEDKRVARAHAQPCLVPSVQLHACLLVRDELERRVENLNTALDRSSGIVEELTEQQRGAREAMNAAMRARDATSKELDAVREELAAVHERLHVCTVETREAKVRQPRPELSLDAGVVITGPCCLGVFV
jgi:hypothetical protein